MSALGQKRTFLRSVAMSALPPKADIGERDDDVRVAPKAAIGTFAFLTLINVPNGDWLLR
jgi:hypothetical protein